MWIQRICKRAKRPTVDTNGKALNGGHKKDFKETIRRGKGNLKNRRNRQKKRLRFFNRSLFLLSGLFSGETLPPAFLFGLGRRLFLRLAALALAAVLYSVVFGATDALVGIFNSENSVRMAQFAHMGMRLYFIGYFFAGFNIVAAGYLSATNRPVEASVTSICRGMVAIVACSLVLSRLFGMNGVWAAFPASELLTAVLTLFLLLRGKKQTA